MMLPAVLFGGVQAAESPEEIVVVPATTALPSTVSVPLLTAVIRKLIGRLLGSEASELASSRA